MTAPPCFQCGAESRVFYRVLFCLACFGSARGQRFLDEAEYFDYLAEDVEEWSCPVCRAPLAALGTEVGNE